MEKNIFVYQKKDVFMGWKKVEAILGSEKNKP
jgi:hypothetical protein